MLSIFQPPPSLTISEWSDQYRYLSPESSAEPGRWTTARAEYQRAIMDAISDPLIPVVVVAKAAQVGWTEMLNNTVGYYVDQDPGPLLMIQPTIELAEAWSKDRLAPMIRDTPRIQERVAEARSRDSENTLRQKIFPGGRLTIVGANAPAGLAARPIRVVLADETDRYPSSAGTEGDPLALASKRQQTFWNRKTLIGSTPKLKDTSVVWREWLRSDQRRFMVPCPYCAAEQYLKWSQVHWDKDEHGNHLPESAEYLCEDCGSLWNDVERWDAIARGRWEATGRYSGVVGFHIPGMISPWIKLSEIAREFLMAGNDPFLLQVWTNTVLGEPWEELAEKLEGFDFLARGENYGAESLPGAIRLLTAGVDVQDDRLELQVVGWGPHDESWVVDYAVIHGDPAQDGIWSELDKLLVHPYRTETDRFLRINAACVDSGGHHTNQVYTFCKRRWRRRIFATKGIPGTGPIFPRVASRGGNKGIEKVYAVAVDTGKQTIYGRLRIEQPGPGFIHFPVRDDIDSEYFAQLTAEQLVTRKRMGRTVKQWVLPSGRRNEALDTMVMALAARMSIRVRIEASLPPSTPPALPEAIEDESEDNAPEAKTPVHPPVPAAPRHPFVPRSESWMGGRGRDWWRR